MTAIIIEDEALAARELESILKKLAPEIEIVARQDSVRGSVQWLKENQVDLIFSDVHLGDGRSFDIFGQVEIKAPVIFITAYDEYALQAFKSQGIDYILKPFDEEEILRALEKVRNWFAKEKKAPRTVRFQERFLVQIGTKIKSVPVAEVAYFMADGKYLMLYTHEGGGYILDQTMAALEERLDPQIFFRINRKFIVSFSAIKEMIRYSNNRIKIGLSPLPPENIEALSLLPLTDCNEVTLQGVQWNLEHAPLLSAHPYAISNMVEQEKVVFTCNQGRVGFYLKYKL